MPQCPSCKTFSGGDAAFCSQCGGWIGDKTKPRRARRVPARLPLYLAGVLLLALGGVLLALYLGEARPPGLSGRPVRTREPAALLRAGGLEGVEPSTSLATKLHPVEMEEPLDRAEATRLALRALVVLDLRRQDDRPLRETRGVLVDDTGVVLCRLSALLGAHRGSCRFLAAEAARIEIVGLSFSAESLDLALIRVERVPSEISALPILADPPSSVFASGDTLYAVIDSRIQEAVVESLQVFVADRVLRPLLGEEPAVSPEAFLALDLYGYVVGLLRFAVDGKLLGEDRPRPAGGGRLVVDPAHSFVQALGRPASLTLADLTARLYEGTFADLFLRGIQAHRAQRWKEGVELLEQALSRVAVDQPASEEVSLATAALRESYFEELQRLLAAQRVDEALPLARVALVRFGLDAVLLTLTGELQLAHRDWAGAVATLLQAHGIESSPRLEGLIEKAYLELAAEVGRTGDARSQEAHLLQGVQVLTSSAALHFEVGKLYFQFSAHDDATRYFERAASLDPALGDAVESFLGKIDDAIKRRDSFVVPIPAGANSIRTAATVDGTAVLDFVIDTGATYTTLPAETAAALGYPTVVDARSTVVLQTANGTIVAPKISIQSLSLGGYSVRNLEVVLLPKAVLGSDPRGLIGLNFLKHFKYTVDASRHEFRLERP